MPKGALVLQEYMRAGELREMKVGSGRDREIDDQLSTGLQSGEMERQRKRDKERSRKDRRWEMKKWKSAQNKK